MARRSLTFKEGSCYLVRFLDHTAGSSDIVEVEIVGWCIGVKSKHVVFSAWRVDDDEDLISNGHEPVSIIKSTILQKRVLTIPALKKTKR